MLLQMVGVQKETETEKTDSKFEIMCNFSDEYWVISNS